MEREQVANEPELGRERPRGRADAGEDGAEDLGELEHCALGDLTVLPTPLGDRIQRVEEEVRIEVRPDREELGVLGFLREEIAPPSLAEEARLEPDVAPEAPPAREEEGAADEDARARGQEAPSHVELAREDLPEPEDDAGADGGVEEQANRAVREVDPLGKEDAPRKWGDEHEGDAHRGPERSRISVLPEPPLDVHHRRADEEDGREPPRLQERPERAPDDRRLAVARGPALHRLHLDWANPPPRDGQTAPPIGPARPLAASPRPLGDAAASPRGRACFATAMNLTLSTARVFASGTTRERRTATLALATAFLLGTATHALFRRSGLGLNFWLWDLLVLAAAAFLLRRGKISATAWGAMAASALLGFSVVLYESEWTLLIAVPATLALLAVVPLLLRDRYDLAALARIPGRVFLSFTRTYEALLETSRLPRIAAGGGANDALAAATRGLLVGIPTAGLFTFLLARDADFAHSLTVIRGAVGDAVVFLVWSLLNAASYLFTYALHRHRDAAAAPAAEQSPLPPYRMAPADGSRAVPTPAAGPRVTVVTWSVVIGQVALVFATFVAANLRHLFGGNALVRAEGGLTYATYLHEGFGALLFATGLSVCLVLAGHWLLRPRGEREPGAPVPGGRVLSFLEAALLVLTGTTVVSCWQRLRIYEDAYGASHLRLGVALVELSVLGVLALTLGKVPRPPLDGPRGGRARLRDGDRRLRERREYRPIHRAKKPRPSGRRKIARCRLPRVPQRRRARGPRPPVRESGRGPGGATDARILPSARGGPPGISRDRTLLEGFPVVVRRASALLLAVLVSRLATPWWSGRDARAWLETDGDAGEALGRELMGFENEDDLARAEPRKDRFTGEWALVTHQMVALGLAQVSLARHPDGRGGLGTEVTDAARKSFLPEMRDFGTRAWRGEDAMAEPRSGLTATPTSLTRRWRSGWRGWSTRSFPHRSPASTTP